MLLISILSLLIIILLVYLLINSSETFYSPINLNQSKSMVSMIDGAIINIVKNNKDNSNDNDYNIPIDKQGNYLALENEIVQISKDPNNNKSIWNIIKLETTNKYLIKSKDNPIFIIQYLNGRMYAVKESTNIPDSQKWITSDREIPQKQLKIVDIYDSPIGPLSSTIPDDPNSISLNLNVNSDLFKSYINDDDNTPISCDEDYYPKDAIDSLCPGCFS